MTDEELNKIMGQKPTPKYYYRLDDFQYTNEPKERVLSGIRDLDFLTNGFELGCITIWTGFTNAGKTTVMTMLAKKSIEQGERIFFFNGEQTKEDFKNNLYIQCSQENELITKQYKTSCVEDTFVKTEKAFALEKTIGNKIFIYNNEAPRSIDDLLYAMEELRRTEKIRVFFLDNFMQIDIPSDNVFQEQTNIMEKLRTFAINKKVHIHLVAHPRKCEKFQTRLTLYDVAGSSNIVNKAYNIISIVRVDSVKQDPKAYEKLEQELLEEKYIPELCGTVLEVLKTKGRKCGIVALTYNAKFKTYSNAPKMDYLGVTQRQKQTQEKEQKQKQEMIPW